MDRGEVPRRMAQKSASQTDRVLRPWRDAQPVHHLIVDDWETARREVMRAFQDDLVLPVPEDARTRILRADPESRACGLSRADRGTFIDPNLDNSRHASASLRRTK